MDSSGYVIGLYPDGLFTTPAMSAASCKFKESGDFPKKVLAADFIP